MRAEVEKYVKKKRGMYAADGGEVPDFVSQSSENDDAPAIDLNSDLDVMSDDPNKNYVEQSSENTGAVGAKKSKFDASGFDAPTTGQSFKFSRADPTNVQNFIKVAPLNAADGGEVPGDDEEEDDDAPEDDSRAETPAPPPAAPAPADDGDAKQQAIKDYLAKQYGQASDDSGIKDAQKEQQHKNFIANISEGLNQIATARGVANGMAPDSGKFYQGIRDQGKAGVEQAQAARQQAIQGFLQKNAIQRQVIQDKMASDDHQTKMNAAAAHAELSKPGTPAALAQFSVLQKIAPDDTAGMDPTKMSVSDVAAAGKMLSIKEKIDANKELAASRASAAHEGSLNRAARAGEVADAKKDAVNRATAVKDFDGLRKDLDSDSASSRTQIGVAAGKVHGADRVMTFADVTPDDLEAAKKDPKAKAALVSKLDSLSPQSYGEVVSGLMSQLNNGGAGSLGQLESLKANTLDQTKANVEQYFTSRKTGAGAGDLILNNLMTLQNERGTSQKVLDDRIGKLKKNHPFAFAHEATKQQAEDMFDQYATLPKDLPGQPAATKQTPVAGAHPPGSVVTLKSGKSYKVLNDNGDLEEIPSTSTAGK